MPTLTLRTERKQILMITPEDLAKMIADKFDLPRGGAKVIDENGIEISPITFVFDSIDERDLDV